MEKLARWALAPVLQAWVASKSDEVERLPRPRDEPAWHSPGPDPDRVLIFGGGPAVGWGVLSHEIGLTGSLGRALSRRTHRGADIYARPLPRLKMGGALAEFGKVRLKDYDAVVVTLGVNDAGALTPTSAWERGLSALIATIVDRTSPNIEIFVAGVHPVRSIPLYDSLPGSIAQAHARRMNATSSRVCERVGNATFIPLTAPEPCEPVRFRDSRSYRHWAEELAESMSPRLTDRIASADYLSGPGTPR